MIQALRRTFSRRGRQRPHSSRNYTTTDHRENNVSDTGVHIPAPGNVKSKSIISILVVLLDGTDVTVDVHVIYFIDIYFLASELLLCEKLF